MELALIILVIGIVFLLNNDNSNNNKLIMGVAQIIDKEITKQFKKRDTKIKELEERIKKLENNS